MMKNILFLILLFASFVVTAQSNLNFAIRYTVGTSTPSGNNYTIAGSVSDFNGIWTASNVAVGDLIFFLDEDRIFELVINSISVQSGSSLTCIAASVAPFVSTSATGNLTGQLAISRKTTKGYCPVPAGANEYLKAAMENRFKQKSDANISNIDNISDANKPVSTATQTALNTKVGTGNNGLTVTGSNVALGGALTANTTVTGANTVGLIINNLTTAQVYSKLGTTTSGFEADSNSTTMTLSNVADATKGGTVQVGKDSVYFAKGGGVSQTALVLKNDSIKLRGLLNSNGALIDSLVTINATTGALGRRNANTVVQRNNPYVAQLPFKNGITAGLTDSLVTVNATTGELGTANLNDIGKEIKSNGTSPTNADNTLYSLQRFQNTLYYKDSITGRMIKINRQLNVNDYGALQNTNSGSAINTNLNASKNLNFLDGSYNINTAVSITTSSDTIIVKGNGKTTWKENSGTSGITSLALTRASKKIIIEGITFDLSGTNGSAISIDSCDEVIIRNCKFINNSASSSCLINNAQKVTISNLSEAGNFSINHSNDILVQNCNFSNATGGLTILSCSNVAVDNNFFTKNTHRYPLIVSNYGSETGYKNTNVMITKNTVVGDSTTYSSGTGSADQLSLNHCDVLKVDGNISIGGGDMGITVELCKNFTVTNNTASGNSVGGISIQGINGLVSNNYLKNNGTGTTSHQNFAIYNTDSVAIHSNYSYLDTSSTANIAYYHLSLSGINTLSIKNNVLVGKYFTPAGYLNKPCFTCPISSNQTATGSYTEIDNVQDYTIIEDNFSNPQIKIKLRKYPSSGIKNNVFEMQDYQGSWFFRAGQDLAGGKIRMGIAGGNGTSANLDIIGGSNNYENSLTYQMLPTGINYNMFKTSDGSLTPMWMGYVNRGIQKGYKTGLWFGVTSISKSNIVAGIDSSGTLYSKNLTIENLQAGSTSDSILSSSAGVLRRLSIQQVLGNTSQTSTNPTTGSTITLIAGISKLVVSSATTIAALTIPFPTSPIDNQQFLITGIGQANGAGLVTALSWTGGTINSASATPTTLSAGDSIRFDYHSTSSTWIRIIL